MRDKEKVDFYIFLTYLPRFGEHRLSTFEQKFIIVPTSELEKRIQIKKAGNRGVFFFCFNFEGKKVVEKRDAVTNYSDYLNRWDLIEHALEG